MGIKFLCSQCGKKLNVKSFLAGKRGICPHCGAGVDIPGEKQQPAMAGAPAAAASAAPTINPAANPLATGMPTITPMGQAASPALQPAAVSQPAAAPSYPAVSPVAASPMPAIVPTSAPLSGPAVPVSVPASPMAMRPGPAPSGQMAVPAGPAIAVPAGPAMVPVPPAAPMSHAAATQDPIIEAPNAVWYVRPPSGGQFGPAPGETMRKWIGEGRVTADSLVWREGWGDWKKASTVFPQLGAGNEPALITAGPTASGKTPLAPRTPTSSNSTAVILIVALVVLIIPLIIALVYLITRGGLGK